MHPVFIYLLFTHVQGAAATFMTQPLDVLKTRQMNAKPGEFRVANSCRFIINTKALKVINY